MRRSKVLEKLRKGETVISISTSFTNSPRVTELAAMIGFDCLWIDMEHRPYDYDDVYKMIMGARAADADCLVRIRKESYAEYFRVIEDGASGIMIPHCKNQEGARYAVMNCKYPPLGARGLDGVGVDADYGLAKFADHMIHANKETFIVLQIEDREAVDCIEEITAVEGFDLLFVGPLDISASYGAIGDFNNPLITRALQKVAEATAKHGKWWGTSTGNLDIARQYIEMGARFINAGSDRGILVSGFKKTLADFCSLKSMK